MIRARIRKVLAVSGALLALLTISGAVALPVGAGPAVTPGRQDPEDEEPTQADPFDRLTSCIGAGGRLLVVLLIDESVSLKKTDPDDQRVAAARAAVTSLDRLREAGVGGSEAKIDLLVARFSYDFRPVRGGWTPLTAATRDRLDRSIAQLKNQNSGRDTDFYNALDGARTALAAQAAEVTDASSAPPCKAILFFTDGNPSLEIRDEPGEAEQFPVDKPYAPDNDLSTKAEKDEALDQMIQGLCEEGGVVDRVRADRVTLITVPLVRARGRDTMGEGPRRLIEAITTGQKEERTCGDPETDNPGAYLEAADALELLRAFDLIAARIAGGSLVGEPERLTPCAEELSADCSVEFTVSRSLLRVHIFAAVTDDETRVVIQPPDGDPLELEAGQNSTEPIGDVPAESVWISERALTVDLDVPTDGTGSGKWSVGLVGSPDADPGVIQVMSITNLVATLTEGSSLELGKESELVAVVRTRDGKEPQQTLAGTNIGGAITDPITGKTGRVTFTPDGERHVARYTVPRAVTSVAVRLSLRLDATTSDGADLSSVSPDIELAVRRPEGYPQVAPPRLELSSITGHGAAEGTLIFVKPTKGSGCAWLDELTVNRSPPEAGEFEIEADGIGQAKSDCTPVGGTVEVPVKVKAGSRADGTATGYVRVYLDSQSNGADPIATDIPIAFEMARGIDEAKRLALAAGLMLGGMLLPLALLVAINQLTTRFQTLSNVRAAMIPVVLTGTDRLVRDNYERETLALTEEDFQSLEGKGGDRRFTWAGLEFTATTPLNPFESPHATIAPEAGTAHVSREGRRTDLPLGLTGAWLFLLDQDATRATAERIAARGGGTIDSRNEIRGHLVAFIATGPFEGQAGRLQKDISARLPHTAHRLARIAHV